MAILFVLIPPSLTLPLAQKAETFQISKYVAAINMLESSFLYSKNITDLEGITATIKKVAKIDRLPEDNTVEGMQIVQMAWDKVDIFNAESQSQKTVAKLTYVRASEASAKMS